MELTPELTWAAVAGFVRQHTHDVRNHLNSLDLEAALLSDLVGEDEARESVVRLRRQIREAAASLRALSAKFSDAPPGDVLMAATDIFEIWKEQHASGDFPEVQWENRLGSETVSVDPDAIAAIFRELLQNAKQFGSTPPLMARAEVLQGDAVYTLEEGKSAEVNPAGWGRVPFRSTRRGGYGLGLWEVERRARASGGRIVREFLPKESKLVTQIHLPIAAK